MPSIVTLTTDFEESEPYVASAKGVICSRCPGVQVLDLSHQIPRGNIREGALFMAGAVPYFPKGSVHIVAVSSGQPPIVMQMEGQYIVCPNNGLISLLAERHTIEETRGITNPDIVITEEGQTYFGRDVFAPAAAHLACGGSMQDLGDPIENVALLDLPKPEKAGERRVGGQVMHVNRFGTLVTNIHRSFLSGASVSNVIVGDFPVGGLRNAYGDVELGCPVALYGSAGYLEIAYNGDRADKRLNMGVGIIIQVEIEAG